VIIKTKDFYGAANEIQNSFRSEWYELEDVISKMPVYLKPSGESGMEGDPIFDPVGINAHVKEKLTSKGWNAGASIPSQFDRLGKDVDFAKNGAILEVQFSNYPFVSNNIIRSETFYQKNISFGGDETGILFIVSKGKMFPASQSTLYYEQAVGQIKSIEVDLDIPIRVVGMFESKNKVVDVKWTDYEDRYSRDPETRTTVEATIVPDGARCNIDLSNQQGGTQQGIGI